MKFSLFLLFIVLTQFAVCQKKQPVNLFLGGQTSFMPYGLLNGYTGGGFGAGLQAVFNTKHKLKPHIDVSANLFSINKIAFVFENGQTTGPLQTVASTFGGFIYVPANKIELAFSAGPAFHDEGTSVGIKPYIAYYLGKKKVIKAYTSLTHIFKPYPFSEKNTGIISAGLAVKLF